MGIAGKDGQKNGGIKDIKKDRDKIPVFFIFPDIF
jgi:hypothetical protein